MRGALLVLLIAFTVFGARLVQIQGLDASALAAAAVENRQMSRPLAAPRGDITDAHGAVLATTVNRLNLTVDQRLVPGYKKKVDGKPVVVGVEQAAADLAPVLGIPAAKVAERITGKRAFAYVKKDITPQKWRAVKELGIPGLFAEPAPKRVYPADAVGSAVVGFVGADGEPLAGIELAHNATLQGVDGVVTFERGQDGVEIPTGRSSQQPAIPGGSIRLTLDRDLQWKAQEALAEQIKATGAESGSIVVLDPRTGHVLALAAEPTFDANRPGAAAAADRGNRALLDVFEPGSVSKVVTAAAALQEGVVGSGTRMVVPDSIARGGKIFHDSHRHPPEKLTFAGVLAKSSNVGTIMAGEKVPPSVLHRYLTRFGLGRSTGIGLPESPGLLAPSAEWNRSQRYTVLFGQGLAVNALQAAGVYATIANDGVRVPPRVVAGTTAPGGAFTPAERPEATRAVSKKTARLIARMLESVVGEEGTAETAAVPGYRVAGKTGTAQAADPDCACYRGYTASFIGFAPAEAPRLVVSVVLQRPTKGHYGGQVAAPVFADVMGYALAQRGVPPSTRRAPNLPLTYE